MLHPEGRLNGQADEIVGWVEKDQNSTLKEGRGEGKVEIIESYHIRKGKGTYKKGNEH